MGESSLDICQINRFDHGGGSEVVAWNLLNAYRARGHVSRLVVGQKLSSDPDVWLMPHDRTSNPWRRFWWRRHSIVSEGAHLDRQAWKQSRLTHRLAEPSSIVAKWLGREDFSYPGVWRLFELFSRAPDVVHLHNLHGDYFDLRALPWLSRRVPVFLTLHDAWLLSGHCTHSLDCERWKTGCGQCPDLSLPAPLLRDGTAYNWRRKRDLFARCRLFISTPSQWLMEKVERSMLADGIEEARVIPNGADLQTYCPGSQEDSRARLGLPLDSRLLLFVAGNVWKDFDLVRGVFREIRASIPERTKLVVLSANPPDTPADQDVRFVPFQSSASVVADYYRAADVYVHAARADTFPNAVIEAQACGCPVVASAVGGIPEQIESGATGYLVDVDAVQEFKRLVEALLLDSALRCRIGHAAAERAKARYDLRRQVGEYLDWYGEVGNRISSGVHVN